ncbi:serine/threonine protein kinase [Paenibacillus sp. MZ04-78.2]|uniref:serine/threonine protein kinase n=1 Tax=Paenibacillus sp. MZ04-78.2 TaxID=2962034 RepID=UPI0020B90201|nr:serine/threonine protein kinase [Paenibacillus sp. MZ04-78.2]MCP3774098.1 serine/threonine protein kinase [Paenibacillus sp. MZ04-78.2]
MNVHWTMADEALRSITVTGSERNEPVIVSDYSEELRCIGIGTDAAVFTYDRTPGYAFKIYSDLALALGKREMEKQVYERLEGIPYFPVYYGCGERYLVMSHESGVTLLDCLLEGIPVPEQAILDVEEARALVRSRGLNPRDIHLKNVILQSGRGKVLDVSEYALEGDDKRWEHLVWAYRVVYPGIEGIKIPAWVLDAIKNGYARLDQANLSLDDFARRVSQLFFKFLK